MKSYQHCNTEILLDLYEFYCESKSNKNEVKKIKEEIIRRITGFEEISNQSDKKSQLHNGRP